ncbi:MAG: hypothetical protein JSR96_00710 [Proteobacteria bacterium]|nr:hypothetical protein [Pseudomonadota bacterium]
MPDRFAGYSDSPIAPSAVAFAITPSDTVEITATKAIYVGTGGHVTLRPIGAAADVTYRNVPTGSYLTVRASFVRATGTTATDIVGEA